MQNSNINFEDLAEAVLQDLADNIEKADKEYLLDLDVRDGVIKIDLPDQKQYVINIHRVLQEIWLSSPYSNAFHFFYDNNLKCWKDNKGNNLHKLLSKELLNHLNIKVEL